MTIIRHQQQIHTTIGRTTCSLIADAIYKIALLYFHNFISSFGFIKFEREKLKYNVLS